MATVDPFAAVKASFPGARGYLDTATIGLPPSAAIDAMREEIAAWQHGRASAPGYDSWVSRGREAFARLVGADAERVAVGSQVSVFAGLVAASLPAGSEVLCAEGDFTSLLFPFLVQRERGVRVRFAPLDRFADEINPATDLAVVSAVQSGDGVVADLEAIAGSADANDAATFVDATQACGWLPLDAGGYDYVACSAYKWLLSPRGTAFFTVKQERLAEITPHTANWYAGDDRWASLYGEPLRLAADARRLDVSPAWLCWVGAAPAIELLAGIGSEAIGSHAVGLANRLRNALGMAPSESPMVLLEGPGARERLERADIRASVRGERVRVCFHLYNDERDADDVAEALT